MTRRHRAALAAGLVAAFLTAGASARAADLTWAPAGGTAADWTWDTGTTRAWKDAAGQAAFSAGDNAIFDSTEAQAPENRTVAVSGGGG